MAINRRAFIRNTALAGAAGSITALAGGCGGNNGALSGGNTSGTHPKNGITLWNGWTGGDNKAMLEQVLNKYEQSPGGVKVANTTLPWDSFFVKWVLASKSGNPPDVVIHHQTEVEQFASNGVTRNITSLAEKSDIDLAQIPDFNRQLAHYNGELHSVPLDSYTIATYYNVDLASRAGLNPNQPPTSLDELLNWTDKLTVRKGSQIVQEGYTYYGTPLLWVWQYLRSQFGGESLLKDGEWQFNDHPSHEALQLMVDFIYKYKVANPPPAQSTTVDPFGIQKAGLQMNGPWNVNLRMTQKLNFKTASSKLGLGSDQVWANGHCLAMSKGAADDLADQSMDFMKWFYDNYALAASTVGTIPLNKKVLASKEWTSAKQHPYYAPFQKDLANAVFDPSIRNYTEVFEAASASAPLNLYIPQALRNEMSVNDALSAIQSGVSSQAQVN